MNVCRRGDQEVESSPARLPTAIHNSGGQPPPLPRNGGVHGQGVERCFDRAEPLRPESSFVVVFGNEDAEVHLGE